MGTTEIQEIPFKYREKNVCSKDDKPQERIAHRGCEVTVLRDIKNLTAHGAEQPALSGPALTKWLN